jgi:hypothetical protein
MSSLLVAGLVFVIVTVVVFAATSLFDQRKAQSRVLRDRLTTVQNIEQAAPDAALLRDADFEPAEDSSPGQR